MRAGDELQILESTTPLARDLGRPWPIDAFLRVAIGLSRAIAALHERGVVHKDLQPSQILIDGGTVSLRSELAPGGGFAYMAPERTGRMNRSIDARSDLYSIGVVLYEMATGALPFDAADPIGWIHCQLAQQPVPPVEHGVPAAISAIVMKLLAKAAEDRYQTAAGLEADLRACARQLEATGAIEPFELALRDASSRFAIPDRLYGRAGEARQLLAAYARVAEQGERAVVMVSGYSGVGKSSVIRELHKASPRGLFASGKYDQQKRDIPYAPLAQAFRGLVAQLAASPSAARTQWRAELAEALAVNGALVVGLVPELEALVGAQPAVPEAPAADAQRRFHEVFRKFVGVLARPAHPLAVFLDDLQWLDDASLDLLAYLATEPTLRHLLIIGAFRDHEVGPGHSLRRRLEAIRAAGTAIDDVVLAPLAPGDLQQLVADALRTERERAAPLAELIHDKTAGNPFFAIQFLRTLVDQGLVAFDPAGARWRWDVERIRGRGFTDNVAELVTARLEALPADTRAGLAALACLGHSVRSETLAAVYELSEDGVHRAMQDYVSAGVTVRTPDGYAFAHDRILEAAYAMVAEPARVAEHLRIGRRLVAQGADRLDDRLFEIVHHLNRGARDIVERAERDRVAELNLAASRRARAATASSAALAYAEAGRTLLDDDAWQRDRGLTFALELQLAECEFLVAELARAEHRLEQLADRAVSFTERAAVVFVQATLYTSMADRTDRAIELGLAFLRHAGIDWPAHPSRALVEREHAELVARIRGRSVEDLRQRPTVDDPQVVATLDVLLALFGPTHNSDHQLLQLLLCRMGNLGLAHGYTNASPFAYAYLGMVVAADFDDVPTGYLLAKLALDLVETPGFGRYRGRVYHTFGTHVLPFTEPLARAAGWLRRGLAASREAGDVTYIGFGSGVLASFLFVSGEPLARVVGETEAALAVARAAKFGLMTDVIASLRRVVRALRDRSTLDDRSPDARYERDAEPDDRSSDIMAAFYWIRTLQAHVIYGDTVAAIRALAKAEPHAALTAGFFELAEYHFYAALARAAWLDTAPDAERGALRQAIAAHRDRLARWAAHCPANFADRVALIDAELARCDGRALDAMQAYEQAIQAARSHQLVHQEAIALEAAARCHRALGLETTAVAYFERARDAYRRWGADGKVRQLDELAPSVWVEAPAASLAALDLATVAKTSAAVSIEVGVERLLESLMTIALQHAGAQRGVLVLQHGDTPWIEAEANTRARGVAVRVQRVAADAGAVLRPVLDRALRDREAVVLDDAAASEAFAAEPYVASQAIRSVLCLPLLKERDAIGALYLENNLTSHAFRADQLDLLKLLASHAAISLENAALAQKQALLKEVHHRVKNNLQLVSSLLNLQAARVDDPAVAELFADARNRVRSIALVHENLYRAGDFSRIAMAGHLRALCAQLQRAYQLPDQPIALEVEVGALHLDMNRAVTCGLIINELVSNALKHAFPGGRRGTIRVAIEATETRRRLVVTDDGIGLPARFEAGRGDSLGLQLVRDLTEQLHGTMAVARGPGTAFSITFDDEGPA